MRWFLVKCDFDYLLEKQWAPVCRIFSPKFNETDQRRGFGLEKNSRFELRRRTQNINFYIFVYWRSSAFPTATGVAISPKLLRNPVPSTCTSTSVTLALGQQDVSTPGDFTISLYVVTTWASEPVNKLLVSTRFAAKWYHLLMNAPWLTTNIHAGLGRFSWISDPFFASGKTVSSQNCNIRSRSAVSPISSMDGDCWSRNNRWPWRLPMNWHPDQHDRLDNGWETHLSPQNRCLMEWNSCMMLQDCACGLRFTSWSNRWSAVIYL